MTYGNAASSLRLVVPEAQAVHGLAKKFQTGYGDEMNLPVMSLVMEPPTVEPQMISWFI
ncbi:MAG: hypothetical protein ACR2OE_19295 [Thermomicrobiales bacterium]